MFLIERTILFGGLDRTWLPTFGTGIVTLHPVGNGLLLEYVAATRDGGRGLLDRFHGDRTCLSRGFCRD
jgi:hypothetical protein